MDKRSASIDFYAVEVPWPAHPAVAVQRFLGSDEGVWFDSGKLLASAECSHRVESEWSFAAASPSATIEQEMPGVARLLAGLGESEFGDAWLALRSATGGWATSARPASGQAIREALAKSGLLGVESAPLPGWYGFFGYELAGSIERLPEPAIDDMHFPLARLARFDGGILLNHEFRRAWAVAIALPGTETTRASDPRAELLEQWKHASQAISTPASATRIRARLETSRREHESRVRRVLDYIRAGDVYQVNLAHRIGLEGFDDAVASFAALREINPAPHAAFFRWPGHAVLSVSPELMIRVEGQRVTTRPIKGTRSRGGSEEADQAALRELLASRKDAAELAMIIDLHRNDLGRVCRPGSIRVAEARQPETHPRVHHTVATIEGRLREDCDAFDALRASFPAGSVTGVPKIRAMQIIRELEPVRRGVYTGAIGRLEPDGLLEFSVAIRIVQVSGEKGRLHVGGGIVAESDPAAEFNETMAKADGILRGLSASLDPEANTAIDRGTSAGGRATAKAPPHRYTTPHV